MIELPITHGKQLLAATPWFVVITALAVLVWHSAKSMERLDTVVTTVGKIDAKVSQIQDSFVSHDRRIFRLEIQDGIRR